MSWISLITFGSFFFGTRMSMVDVRHALQFNWQATLEAEFMSGDAGCGRRLLDQLEACLQDLPCDRMLQSTMHNYWLVRNTSWGEVLSDEEAQLEGKILHFDFTYRAVGGIWVQAPAQGSNERKRVQFAYVLGSVLGSRGVVLSSLICSTESWENMDAVLRMAFEKTKVAPLQIWVDDFKRWGKKIGGGGVWSRGRGSHICGSRLETHQGAIASEFGPEAQ